MKRLRPFSMLLLGCALGSSGCAALTVDEIADRPIALRFLDVETARRRAEALSDAQSGGPATSEGVAHVDAIGSYFKQLAGVANVPAHTKEEFAGRLALFDPRTEAVDLVRSARRGAVPRAWSPNHDRLLFAQLVDDFFQLFELNLATRDVRQVTRGPTVHPSGCYGPEGRLVLVAARVRGERAVAEIELTGPGGVGRTTISAGPFDRSVTCAPDGSSIAWVQDDEKGRSWIMTRAPVVGGENRRIAPGDAPTYTPDGRWIVYVARIKRSNELYRIRPNGVGRTPVGRHTTVEKQPSVSPDGKLVVYVAETEFRKKLYLRRMDGTGDRILMDDGDGEFPVW